MYADSRDGLEREAEQFCYVCQGRKGTGVDSISRCFGSNWVIPLCCKPKGRGWVWFTKLAHHVCPRRAIGNVEGLAQVAYNVVRIVGRDIPGLGDCSNSVGN